MHLPVIHPEPGEHADEHGDRTPQEWVAWALAKFGDRRLIVTTGFGMEGCVMIDMIAQLGALLTVHYLDTHFLFAQTHALRHRLELRYPAISFVNAGTAYTPEQQANEYGPELWRRLPDACCDLRKVQPMKTLVQGADAWMTAIRRSQSQTRASIRHVEWDSQFELVKINPLAAWSREEVWDYAVANGVPYNELHEQGYPSIGCTNCTKAVPGAGVTDYSRAGRWAGLNKTECGLHRDATDGGAGI